MTTRRLLLLIALIAVVIPMPQIASAAIVVDIGGSPPQNPGTDPNSVTIEGGYGTCQGGGAAITITNFSTGTARVEVISDPGTNGIDYLAVKNAKITANCAVTDFRIAFGFNHQSMPATPPSLRYTYNVKGGLARGTSAPPGAYVKVKASYWSPPATPPSTAYNAAGKVGAEKQSSAYTFTNLVDFTPNLTTITDPRGLQGEFTFKLPAQNDVLKITTYYVQNSPASGGGDGGGGLLSTFCPTTQATAKAFGCPDCVSEDGLVAEDAKVQVFAHATWNNLSQDLASGRGEYLTSLATLLKVPTDQQAAFFSLAEDHYIALTKTDTATPDDFLATLRERMPAYVSVARAEITRQ